MEDFVICFFLGKANEKTVPINSLLKEEGLISFKMIELTNLELDQKVNFTLRDTLNSQVKIQPKSVEELSKGLDEINLEPILLTVDTRSVELELEWHCSDEINERVIAQLHYSTLDGGHLLWPEHFPTIKEVIKDIVNQKLIDIE